VSQIPENNPDGWQPDRPAESGGHQQQGYHGQPGPGSYAAPQPENTPVLSEFDHLFRDSSPDSRRGVSDPAPAAAAQYPNLNPVPPQWPATVGGHAEIAPAQSQPGQYPVQQYQQQQQYPGQESGQQYQQQDPNQQQYQQYQQGSEQQQYQQQTDQNQTVYLAAQPQAPTQAIEYPRQYQLEQAGGYGPPAAYQPAGQSAGYPDEQQQQWSGQDDGYGGGGKSKRNRILIAGGAMVVVIVLIVLLNSGGGATKAPPVAAATTAAPTAGQQAAGLMAIVSQSGALRSEAISAVDDLTSSSCGQLPGDETALQATSKARSAQASAVAKLDVASLPDGTQVVSELAQAWTASATSDAAYAQIAADLSAAGTSNCKSPSKKDSNYSAAVQADGDATRAKTNAASLWNNNLATAAGLDLTQINASQL
jgi:hypothetical protein